MASIGKDQGTLKVIRNLSFPPWKTTVIDFPHSPDSKKEKEQKCFRVAMES